MITRTHRRPWAWWRRPGSLLAVAVVAVGSLAVSPAQPASADPNALTTDKSVSVPTAWWTYRNVEPDFISDRLKAHGARITNIEPDNSTGTRFSVVMVRNAGSYQVPGWWWYYGLTYEQVKSKISGTGGRLIDIEPYVVDGRVRYAIVLVSNTGAAARAWWWLTGVTTTAISDLLKAGSPSIEDPAKRLIDIESYTVGGVKRYSAIMIANTGADAKAWQWWYGQTPASVAQKVSAFGGRIINLERQEDGTYNFIQVRNSGNDGHAWRYYYGLSASLTPLQVAMQYNMRLIDIESYVVNGQTRYDVVMIDNVDRETRRLTELMAGAFTGSNGLPTADFGFYLKRVGGGTVTGLQTSLTWEPASAIKAVHNLAVLQSGESLGSNFVYYNYPNSPSNPNTKDACPITGDETAANQLTSTLDFGKDVMMSNSDNRTTRGIVLRYGLPAIQDTAEGAGMDNTTIQQHSIGCGWDGGLRNDTTLVDLGRLYEGVEDGTLLADPQRTEFFQPMNNGVNATLSAIVTAEANAVGKGGIADDFVDEMRNHFKGGSYTIPCGEAPCTSGWMYIRTIAGRMALPVWNRDGTLGERTYVYGSFVDDQVQCNGCSTAAWDNARATINAELFRAEIRSALQTW
jgi:hypothetical protein